MVERETGTQKTVVEELAEVRARELELIHTPCVECGHPYGSHTFKTLEGKCARTTHVSESGAEWRPVKCRCKAFVDPSSVLVVGGSPDRGNE